MKRTRWNDYGGGLPAIVGVVLVVLMTSACDQGDSLEALTVDPANVELASRNETVRFRVTDGLRELSLPLTWEVSNTAVGNIIAEEGTDAEYVRFTSGVNIVMVRDQYGAEGFATVTSPGDVMPPDSGYNLILVPNPDEEIPEGVSTVSIKVINGEPPYRWSVGDTAKGSVPAGAENDTVTYQSSAPGDNTVICVDRNGARGTVIITQLPRP